MSDPSVQAGPIASSSHSRSNSGALIPQPVKVGELGYTPSSEDAAAAENQGVVTNGLSTPSSPSTLAGDHPTKVKARCTYTIGIFTTLHSTTPNKRLGGVSNDTACRIGYILLAIGSVTVAWYFSVKAISKSPGPPPPSSSLSDGSSMGASVSFVHIAFAISLAMLLFFLHRVVHGALTERRAYLKPSDDILPRYDSRPYDGTADTDVVARVQITRGLFGPWTQPLSMSRLSRPDGEGRGAGASVDEFVMVGPPPPAYGHTRGSTLLLRGLPGLDDARSVRSSHSLTQSEFVLGPPPGSPPTAQQLDLHVPNPGPHLVY